MDCVPTESNYDVIPNNVVYKMIFPPNSIEKIRDYNFRDPAVVNKNIIRHIRNNHQSLSKAIQTGFYTKYRFDSEVVMVDINYVNTNEYFGNIDTPSAIFLFNEKKLGEWALIHMQPELCVNIVEFMGGNRKFSDVGNRVLTSLEQRLVNRVMNMILNEVKNVWSGYIELDLGNHGYQSDISSLLAYANRYTAIVVNYEINYYEKKSRFEIVYSYDDLNSRLDLSDESKENEQAIEELDEETRNKLERELKKSRIQLIAQLGTAEVSLNRILNLKVGDVIKLNQKVSSPLKIFVNGIEKLSAYPGQSAEKRAVRVYQIPLEETYE